jgi:hypothetical protein
MKQHPLQVYIDDADLQRLEKWANTRGWTKSQAVRIAVRALTQDKAEDPILLASGMIEALPEDLSEKFDRYLQETYVAEKKPRYNRIRKRKFYFRG